MQKAIALSEANLCPSCGKDILTYKNEPQWCQHCEWNLFNDSPHSKTLYSKIYYKIGRKLSKNLLSEIQKDISSRPRNSFAKYVAFSIATVIHFSAIFLVATAVLCITTLPIVVGGALALFLFLVSWNLRPNLGKWPKKDVLDRNKYPTLYTLTDKISDELKTKRFSGIVLVQDFNAYYSEIGFPMFKRKLLTIGVPLIYVLDKDEFVALLSHETSHGANGDISRGSYIAAALANLAGWYFMLKPQSDYEGHIQGAGIAVFIGNLFGTLASFVPWFFYYILAHLLLRQNQESEYFADGLAAEVAGSSHLKSMLLKLRAANPFYHLVEKAAQSKSNVFELISSEGLPAQSSHEFERLRRIEEKVGLSLDATHPPLEYRIKYLETLPQFIPTVKITQDDFNKINIEIHEETKIINQKLVDDYLITVT